MKINQDLINKGYSSNDILSRFKCNESKDFIALENKFENFSINNNYNYASNIISEKNELPDINLDLSKIVLYYKNSNNSTPNDLIKEIVLFNNYYEILIKNISLDKIETMKEKSVIYYLFYFMSRALFYIIMNINFIPSKELNIKEYSKFFMNYKNIIKACKLYIKQNLEQNKIANNQDNNIDNIIYSSFNCINNSKNEFKEAIINCQNFLAIILLSTESNNIIRNTLNKDMSELMEIFVDNMDLLFNINKYFSIIDYKIFYNDAMSKKINFKKEFANFLKNEKIKKELKKQQEKKEEIDEKEKEKEK